MQKKNDPIKAVKSNDGKNELHIDKKLDCDKEIVFLDKSKSSIKHYRDLDENTKVEIFIKVKNDGQERYSRDKNDEISYYLNSSAWESEEKRDKARKEADIGFLKKNNNVLNLIGKWKNLSDEIEYKINVDADKISMQIKNRNNPDDRRILLKDSNIDVKAKFYLADEITLEDVLDNFPNSDSYLSKGKITLLVALVTIFLLLVFFRKNIWNWIKRKIKGESEEERKYREQIEIF